MKKGTSGVPQSIILRTFYSAYRDQSFTEARETFAYRVLMRRIAEPDESGRSERFAGDHGDVIFLQQILTEVKAVIIAVEGRFCKDFAKIDVDVKRPVWREHIELGKLTQDRDGQVTSLAQNFHFVSHQGGAVFEGFNRSVFDKRRQTSR